MKLILLATSVFLTIFSFFVVEKEIFYGEYNYYCRYGDEHSTLKINKNNTFEYKERERAVCLFCYYRQLWGETNGTWIKKQDTLILNSTRKLNKTNYGKIIPENKINEDSLSIKFIDPHDNSLHQFVLIDLITNKDTLHTHSGVNGIITIPRTKISYIKATNIGYRESTFSLNSLKNDYTIILEKDNGKRDCSFKNKKFLLKEDKLFIIGSKDTYCENYYTKK